MFSKSFYAALFSTAIYSHVAAAASNSTSTVALDPKAVDCFITVPQNPLTAEGLATPYILQPPCSMGVGTQQAFAEAAVYDPATGGISIYHPLVSNAGDQPAAKPVVPVLPKGAVVGLWFGFNGATLQLIDANGKDANASPSLKGANCVNGLPGITGDIFGQVSWCNAEQWFTAVNSGIKAGTVVVPPLGKDSNGNTCPTSRSFSITDADPSDNVPTQYILVGNATAQDTDANRKALGAGAEVINNASDEALLTNILDPLIGCTPFLAPSLDNPGAKVPALALSELQASLELNPALVPLNDPDCLTTKDGAISIDKANTYRLGVNQPLVGSGATSGALQPYCDGLVAGTPPFLKGFESIFTAQTTPDAGVGNNLFTFLCGRFLSSLTILKCPPPAFQPIVCKTDANGAATSCVITLSNTTTTNNAVVTTNTTTTTTSAISTSTTLSVKFANTTSIQLNTALTSAAAASSSVASVAKTTQGNTITEIRVVNIEIVTFFIFVINLGGHLPPSVLKHSDNSGRFVVIQEIFVDFAPACKRACNHQFTACSAGAAKSGAAFSVADCQAQENKCLGVAATASVTGSAPPTVTATATVVAKSSVGANAAAAKTTAAPVVKAAASPVAVAAANANNAQCPAPTATVTVIPAAITSTVSQCTATATVTTTATVFSSCTASTVVTQMVTVTVTAGASDGAASATAAAGLASRHLGRHRRALGKY